MTSELVHRCRRAAQLVLLALVLLASGRFAWTSFERWWFGEEPPLASADQGAAPAADAQPVEPTANVLPEPPAGELIPVMLSVSHGDHRSEVFLDGMPLGHTAYVGDVSCRRGTDVTVRIQPKQGAAIEHVRRCDGSMIVVKEP